MIESLTTLLNNGANPALRYQNNLELPEDLARTIIRCIENGANLSAHLQKLVTLITVYDYRLVAEYLAAWQQRDETVLSIFDRMLAAFNARNIQKERFQLAYAHFVNSIGAPKKANVSFTTFLEDVFDAGNNRLVVYLYNEQYQAPLMLLIEAVGAMLEKFIEQQYDLPGLNAVVRQGLVRTWYFPDGMPIVSKRENRQKRGRFRREQSNYAILTDRFGKQPRILAEPDNSEDYIMIQIAQPIAVIHDGYSNQHYALYAREEGIPLDDLLFKERAGNVRNGFLRDYRLILDMLYDSGVLWGDMSPRNILVKREGHITTYTLVDFEKTLISNTPITLTKRIEHCRGQICVEELGVLCPEEEVLACFEGYFDPSEWELESKVDLPFSPRPEIADILEGRGTSNVTLGEYNTIDSAIMEVRLPDVDPQTKVRRFPGHLGFKVEHYLSCAGFTNAGDYDRKTTEVLIAAKQQGCFDLVVAMLADVVNALESTFLKAEFMGLLQGGFSGNIPPPQQEIENLTRILDVLYEMRQHKAIYSHLVAKLQADAQIGLS